MNNVKQDFLSCAPNYVAPIARLSLASWKKGLLNPDKM